jgi:periplasmic divalent cation tolerance protein
MTHGAAARMVFVTVPSAQVGESLARALVGARLAACGNLVGPVRSYYHYQGAYEEGEEFLLLLKTQETLVEQLVREILLHHPYETPAIEVVKVDRTTPATWAWIQAETS